MAASWVNQLAAWGLAQPDPNRISSAQQVMATKIDQETWQASSGSTQTIHTIKLTPCPSDNSVLVHCSCQDFLVRQLAAKQACKHLARVAMEIVKASNTTSSANTTSTLAPVPVIKPRAPKVKPASGWPTDEIKAAVNTAIESLAARILTTIDAGLHPMLAGTTGVGKTSAVHLVTIKLGCGLEEAVGAESWLDADLIGGWNANREWSWGPIGRAFQRASDGDEKVIIFVDEWTRFSTRAQDVFMRAVQPVDKVLAEAMGLTVPIGAESVYVIESPMLGHRECAPVKNITWIVAGNPWVNPIDPASVRRFEPIEAGLDRSVLKPFNRLPNVKQIVETLWDSYEANELPLPLEYQALVNATSEAQLFLGYLARLRILDRAAEEAARNIIEAKIKL